MAAAPAELPTFLQMDSSNKRHLPQHHRVNPIGNAPLDAPLTSSEVSHNETRTRRKEREAARKKNYHHRVKHEREALRQSVVDLANQLEELTRSDGPGSLGCTDLTWKKRAIQQRDQLCRAQAEQLQLLTATKAHAAYINKVCKQVSPLTSDSDTTTGDPRIDALLRGRNYPPFDLSMYRGHAQRVVESYARVDEVFKGFTVMEDGVRNSIKRRELDGQVELLEHLNKFTQPFSFEMTHKELWNLAKFRHRQLDRMDYEGLANAENTIVLRFRLIRQLSTGMLASVLQRYVIHRYKEENRVVIVWKAHSEGEDVFSGMHSDQSGWIYLQPGAQENSTEVGICIRQVPMQFSISTSGDDIIREFHRVLQSYVNEDVLLITTALDKISLENTLKGICL
ncbi:unnamed protein product [Phytophthora fragariaefolia]|uniref:Unnamed protein product n=1 Tax=Phytophthora fragariaefolia TaxID=1490495 RepID=A0A9W7D7H4_9STRA|nr:unnamed protein product [Phytophthora fragariaefolia]